MAALRRLAAQSCPEASNAVTAAATTHTRAADAFADRVKALPTKPGVYLMKDAEGRVLYVGKAASLRNRVRSYFQTTYGKEPKIKVMVSHVADFEYIVAETESEALLLENLLIKQHKPAYNSRLKDDKTYPYIKIDPREEFPQLYFTRRVQADGARYFGPFASALSVRRTMDLLKKLFPYRSCTKVITGVDERPCLEYHIHRCVGPCIGAVDREEYGDVIHQVIQFLEGESDEVLASLQMRMAAAAGEMRFEEAAVLRDQVRAIESVSENQKVVSARVDDEDVIALAIDQGEVWAELFQVRRGRVVGRDHFLMEGAEAEEPSQVLERFVQQYYDASSAVPPVLLVEHEMEYAELLEEWLTEKRAAAQERENGGRSRRPARRVRIVAPQRGAKRRLVAMVAANAKEGLAQRRIKWLSQSDKVLQALAELQEALSLPALPTRIECYDVSNIQGSNSVGSMVVFEDGKPQTGQYRRFQIKGVDGPDDYASMQEMLRRRFKRLGELRAAGVAPEAASAAADARAAEAPAPSDADALGTARVKRRRRRPKTGAMAAAAYADGAAPERRGSDGGGAWGVVPTLVLIDGGKGHLNAVQQVFLELGVTDVPLASLAKQREEIFLPHMAEPVMLPRSSQGLYLVQRVRDEAHRFAITYHRQRRAKAATRSALDDAPGIGPKRKRALLRRFGSVAGIRAAGLEEIAAVDGMSRASAERLLERIGGG